MKLEEASFDQLVAAYRKLRDEKSLARKRADEEEAGFDKKLDRIGGVILGRFNEMGVESIRTEFGSAFKKKKITVSVGDKDTYFGWIAEDPAERLFFVEARAAKNNVVAYREAHDDLPPGINWREEIEIEVRK